MERRPRVSVLLNSYNQAAYVQEAVESVLSQTFDDFELIITDNGSDDGTPALLAKYADHPRVRLNLCPDNQSVSRRFNQAVQLARGEFVSFLYSDDWYLADKLERQVALFDRLPPNVGVVYSPLRCVNQITGRTWDSGVLQVHANNDALKIVLGDYSLGLLDMISPMTRRECYLRHPFLDDVFAEGESIFFRIALTHRFQVDSLPTAVMRDTGENRGKAIRKNNEMHLAGLAALRADTAFDEARHGAALREYMSRMVRDAAWCNLRVNGGSLWSYRQYFRAFQIEPRNVVHVRTLFGLVLGLIPATPRRVINRVADKQMGILASSTVVESYGGAS